MQQRVTVMVTYGSYQEEVDLICNEDDEAEFIHARAFRKLNCDFLPMAYQSAKILSREYI